MGIAHSIQSTGLMTDFAESILAYPIVLSLHLTFIALMGGMILITNLRLLGFWKSMTITEVVTSFRPWKRVFGILMFSAGALLAFCKAEEYAANPIFWTKMITLGLIGLHGLVFRPIIYNRTEELDKSPVIPGIVKVAAVLSLVLWTTMFTMGRLIAYWD